MNHLRLSSFVRTTLYIRITFGEYAMNRPTRPRPLARRTLPSGLPRTVRDRSRGALVVRATPRLRALASLAVAPPIFHDIPIPIAAAAQPAFPLVPAATPQVAPAVAVAVEPDAMSLRGEFWDICYQQRKGVIHDSRGLRYLAVLVRDTAGGREPIHAKELTGLATGQRGVAIELDADDAVLDAKAKRQLLARLEEIASERDRAAAIEDFTRAARLDDEYEQIADELSRSGAKRGGSGRKTSFTHDGEKARKAVAKAIAEAIAKIAAHPDLAPLAGHLTATVRKGQWLSYDGHAEWRVDFTATLPGR